MSTPAGTVQPLTTPVIVEHDGWTSVSGSVNATEEGLRQQLGAPENRLDEQPPKKKLDIVPAPAEVTPVVHEATPAVEPELEPAATHVTATAAAETPVIEEPPVRESRKPQARIDRFRRLAGDAERARDEAVARATKLETELEALRKPAITTTPPVAVSTTVPSTVKPVWSGEAGYEAQGKSWEDFSADHETWVLAQATDAAKRAAEERYAELRKQDDATRTQSQQDTARKAAIDAHAARLDAARAKYADFDELIEAEIGDLQVPAVSHIVFHHESGPDILYYFAQHPEQLETLGDLKWNGPVVDAIKFSKVPLKLLSHFAQHPDEYQQIVSQHPAQALMAVGALASRLEVAPTVSTSASRVSAAAPPLRTVDRGAQPAGRERKHSAYELAQDKDVDLADYVAVANREERERKRARGY